MAFAARRAHYHPLSVSSEVQTSSNAVSVQLPNGPINHRHLTAFKYLRT
jgi:hypothetical protein